PQHIVLTRAQILGSMPIGVHGLASPACFYGWLDARRKCPPGYCAPPPLSVRRSSVGSGSTARRVRQGRQGGGRERAVARRTQVGSSTSSVRASRVGGTSRPSALAALRLITSSVGF